MCALWCGIATLIMIPFGRVFVSLLAGEVDQLVVDNAYMYIVINTALSLALVPIVVCKSILQSLGRTLWCMISGFTEIIGRAGLSAVVMLMMSGAFGAALGEQMGYTIMCFCTPLAWLLGSLTVLGDYIATMRRFKSLL